MIGKILPLLMAAIGAGAGIGAGLYVKPETTEAPVAMEAAASDEKVDEPKAKLDKKDDKNGEKVEAQNEYVKLNNQFLVPIVVDELVDSLVVMTLSVEVQAGQGEAVYSREPKLRDAFLQVLFDHANVGGFHGEFTNARNMDTLRRALTEVAQKISGDYVEGILITDIARQDI